MQYRREIDGLRALAVVPVALYHADIPGFGGGFIGVDVFLVISGYLITSLILRERQAGTFSIVCFYERRARRLLPALSVVVLACLPFAWLWMSPLEMKDFAQSVVAVNAFVSNWLFAYRSGYFDTTGALKPLLHTWSLAVEEQYYLLFPGFLLLIYSFGKRMAIAALAAFAAASLLMAQWGAVRYPAFTFFLLPTRAWELMLGALLAILTGRMQQEEHHCASRPAYSIAASGGILLIVAAALCFNGELPYPSYYALVPTVGAALVILFATPKTGAGRLLGSKPFVGIGLISYSAYLVHQPMLAFARTRRLGELGIVFSLALVLAAFALAYLSWRWVETPFRRRDGFTRKQVFAAAFASGTALIAIGLVGHLTNGFVQRSPPASLPKTYFALIAPEPQPVNGIDGRLCISQTATICRLNGGRNQKSVLLVGDSHAADYSNAFRRYVADQDVSGWELIMPGCGLLASQRDRHGGECGKARELLLSTIRDRKFDTIILVADYAGYIAWGQNPRAAEQAADLSRLLQDLSASVSNVVFFTPRYTLNADPLRAAMLGRLSEIGVLDSQLKSGAIEAEMPPLGGASGIHVFNERDYLLRLGCGSRYCFNAHTPSLEPLYRDTNHLTSHIASAAFEKAAALF